jgi:hypothetical protein
VIGAPKAKPRVRLTSLLRVEERLVEAEYFARLMFDSPDSTILGYELNAFLSSARSVTFLLQKEFAAVDGFQAWWVSDRSKLGADVAARFFLELRNFSQKEGRIAFVGTSGQNRKWRYMFAGTAEPVPAVLLNRDVADCCLEHLAKLAQAILRVLDAFPYHSCPSLALTPAGIAALGLELDAIEAALGIPVAVSALRPEGSIDDLTRLYRRFVDAVDFDEIRRIAGYEPARPMRRGDDFGVSLGLSMVERIENSRASKISHDHAVRIAIASELLRSKPDGS